MVRSENQPLPGWVKISAIYLFLPLIVFVAGWLRLGIALPLLIGITGSLGMMLAPSGCIPARPNSHVLRSLIGLAAIAVVFASLTGLIPWLPQSTDYQKHNLILGDLIERPWPVRYDGGHFLCYGLGYYMIPAAVAKLLGTYQVGITGFVWATFGLFLFCYGVGRGFAGNPRLGIITLLSGSGLGGFWLVIKSGMLHSMLPGHAAAWSDTSLIKLGLYTSNLDSFTRIFYQPQHGIVGWLGSILIYELVIVRKRWTEAASILAATLFWSPLTALPLAVIGAVGALVHPAGIRFRPTIHLVAALLVTALLVAYYLPHVSIPEKGFIWDMAAGTPWVFAYLLFLLCFVLIPVSAVCWIELKHPYLGPMKPVVIAMTIVLILSPLFKLGQLGDLRMQVSGPAFFFVALAMSKGLIEAPVPKLSAPYCYLAAVFLAGAMFPLLRTANNLLAGTRADYRIETLRANHLNSILDLQMPGFDVTAQYLGNNNSRFAGWILKPPSQMFP